MDSCEANYLLIEVEDTANSRDDYEVTIYPCKFDHVKYPNGSCWKAQGSYNLEDTDGYEQTMEMINGEYVPVDAKGFCISVSEYGMFRCLGKVLKFLNSNFQITSIAWDTIEVKF